MPLILLHVLMMILGALCILAGVSFASLLRSRSWWLKAHRVAGAAGAAGLVAGFTAAFFMIWRMKLEHFDHPHTWAGAVTVFLGVAAPIIGYLQFRLRNRRAQLRLWHRRAGYALLIVMPLALLSGLWAAGLL